MGSGLRKLDCVFLTGLDATHAGGVSTISEHFQVSNFLTPSRSFSGESKFSFGPISKIEVLAAVRGKPLAFQVQEGKARALYLTSLQAQVFSSLLEHPDLQSDLVFLPHHDYGISRSEEIFLKQLHPSIIISNQQDGLEELRVRLESIVPSKLLFIQNLGAVELRFLNGKWNWRNFKT